MIILAKETVRCKIYSIIMRNAIICLLLLIGVSYSLQAQDKIVLRNGRTIEVKVHRSLEDRVEYTYPDNPIVYERQKTGISYIQFEDGRREICDDNLRASERNTTNRTTSQDRATTSRTTPSTTANNRLSNDDEIFWQDVKTTFMESDVNRMTRLKRISAVSSISYKDAIQQLKKKAADIGGTTVLVMDIPEDDNGNDIEVMGLAYRDENMSYTPRSANERNSAPVESSSNERRRRIAQQMDSYNNESDLEYRDNTSRNNTRNTTPARNTNSSARNTGSSTRQTDDNVSTPDAIYLMNGRVVRGTIEEFEPDDFVSIRTVNGRVNEYSMDDVKRVSRGPDRPSGKSAKKSSSNSSSRYDDNRYSNNNRSSSRSGNDYYDDYSVSGYKGTFDAGYNLAMGGTGEKGSFEFNTSHGYQLNEYLFVGAGVGLHMYNARDSRLKDSIGSTSYYPQYIGTNKVPVDSVTYMRAVDSSYMTMPIFLDIRGYLPLQNSAFTPFVMMRAGFAFNLSDGFGAMGLYMNPAIGVKYQVSPMIGINFSVGYSYQSYGGIPKNGGYGYYYIKDATNTKYEAKGAGGISLKLGVEF